MSEFHSNPLSSFYGGSIGEEKEKRWRDGRKGKEKERKLSGRSPVPLLTLPHFPVISYCTRWNIVLTADIICDKLVDV
jgi:hypothetical protein